MVLGNEIKLVSFVSVKKKEKKKKKGSYISTIRFLDSGTKAMNFGPLDHYVCKKSTLKLGNY